MGAKKNTAPMTGVMVARVAPRAWTVSGSYADGTSAVLIRVGEGTSEARPESVLQATAETLASTLLLLHRENEVFEMGLGGKSAIASIDYTSGNHDVPPAYSAVTLRHGRRLERFASGDPAADWLAMQARSREVAAILLLSSSCNSFVTDVPGWVMAESGALEPDGTYDATPARELT